MEIENEDILRKNLVRQISQAGKNLSQTDKLLNFGVANGLLALLPFLHKELVHSDPFRLLRS